MQRPSIDNIIEVLNSKNYRIYDTPNIDWNLNIIGIRAQSLTPKKFDDLLVVFNRFLGSWDIAYFPITTDPSPYYLRNPINRAGTAILKEGQYKSAYKIDIHKRGRKGAHNALCQRLAKVIVYRDSNQDGIVDSNPSNTQAGMFGINIHKGPRGGQFDPENKKYSAGCQVFADDRHFSEFLNKCKNGKEAFGNTFTYTLLHERDFQ